MELGGGFRESCRETVVVNWYFQYSLKMYNV